MRAGSAKDSIRWAVEESELIGGRGSAVRLPPIENG